MMTPDQHAGRIRAGVARGDDRGAIVDLMDLAREFGSKDDVRDALMLLHESARLARDKRTRVQSQSELDQQVRAMLGSALGLTDALEARANSLDRSVPAPPARDGIEGAQPPEFQSIFGVNNLRHIA